MLQMLVAIPDECKELAASHDEELAAKDREIFRQYETDMEEACKMPDFVTRYENSTFNKLMAMLVSPPEGLEELIDSHNEELAAKDTALVEKDKKLAEANEANTKIAEQNRILLEMNVESRKSSGFFNVMRKFFSRFEKHN
jgi:hypothetical protein